MKSMEMYLRPKPRHASWFWAAGMLLLACGIWLGTLAFREHRTVALLAQHQAELQVQQSEQAVPAPSRQQLDVQKQWQQLKNERDFPWEQVFRAIEKTSNSDIELLEFRPDKLNRIIILRGEARNTKSLLNYLETLNARSGWSEVHLAHQQTVQRGALETISFEIKGKLPGA